MLLKYIIGTDTRSAESVKLFFQFSSVYTLGKPLIFKKKSFLVLKEFKRHHKNGNNKDTAYKAKIAKTTHMTMESFFVLCTLFILIYTLKELLRKGERLPFLKNSHTISCRAFTIYFLRFFENRSAAAPAAAIKAPPPMALPQPLSVPDEPEVFPELSFVEESALSLAESPPDERT